MFFIPYNQLDTVAKRLVITKMMSRIKASQEHIDNILSLINPEVKIVDQQVIMAHEPLKAIEEKVKSEKSQMSED